MNHCIFCLADDSNEISSLFSLKNNNFNFRMSSAINLLSTLRVNIAVCRFLPLKRQAKFVADDIQNCFFLFFRENKS